MSTSRFAKYQAMLDADFAQLRSHSKAVVGFAEETSHSSEVPILADVPQSPGMEHLQRGQLGASTQSYCPIQLVAKFPYRFVKHTYKDRVAAKFWDAGKFWNRSWDLYYVWPMDDSKPLILVCQKQFQALLDEVVVSFPDLGDSLAKWTRDGSGFTVKFPDHPRLAPRYLGSSANKQAYQEMERHVPAPGHCMPEETSASPPGKDMLGAFQDILETTLVLNGNKFSKKQKRKHEKAGQAQALQRAQQFLGLHSGLTKKDRNDPSIKALNSELLPSFPFHLSVVFIAIDVESWERNNSYITEIGISSLDTLDLVGLAPGKDGWEWLKKIRTRHFRIHEYIQYVNRDFVSGCPDRFEFGQSEFISLGEAPSVIAECFRPGVPSSSTGDGDIPSNLEAGLELHSTGKRNIVLVGQDVGNDIKYFQQLGYNPLNLSNLVDTLDTLAVHRGFAGEKQPRSLGTILEKLNVIAWNLHNAGNDAQYTMMALVMMAVRDATADKLP